jgi:DNA mismatch repair protein MSH4
MDLKRPDVIMCQFADSSAFVKAVSKLQVRSLTSQFYLTCSVSLPPQIYQPIEIIVPSTASENAAMTKLVSILTESFPSANVVSVKRRYFNEEKGISYLRKLCVAEYRSCEQEVQNRYAGAKTLEWWC